jgi:hypothetical protein
MCYRFKHIKKSVIAHLKQMVKDGYYRSTDEEKVVKLQAFADMMKETYGTPAVTVKLETEARGTYGCYEADQALISLRKPSIVTFLYAFRCHMTHNSVATPARAYGIGVDSQSWATSMFRKACPNMFRKAVANGRIVGMEMVDGKVKNSGYTGNPLADMLASLSHLN